MTRSLRFLGCATVAALCAAGAASATPLRPALPAIPAVQISDAAAQAARQAPICPNGLVCYTPQFLQQAYDFPSGRSAPTGAGQTIVVVTAYGSSSIAADLAQFDAENGLPAPPSFTVVDQAVPTIPDPSADVQSWLLETSLDVEYAHATAPGANIVLAVASSDDSSSFVEVEREVLPSHPGAIVTQSFGGDEQLFQQFDPVSMDALQDIYTQQVASGGTVVASAGDLGSTDQSIFFGSPVQVAAYPASSPLVLAVGGTEGGQYPYGLWQHGRGYGSEQVWNEPFLPGATGGGVSTIFPAPSWQALTGQSGRAEPDVAYNAAVNGGVVVVAGGRHTVMGGTSAAAPQWAGIVALANELRGRQGKPPVGLVTPQLYRLGADGHSYRQDFHDIVVGSNAFGGPESGLPGYSAGPGYDLATGLGTPDVARLLNDLVVHDAARFGLGQLHGPRHGNRGQGHFQLGTGG